MQDIKRLKVGAVLGNTPSGMVAANIVEFDGGEFELSAKRFDGGLVLVDPNRPAGYGFQITGSPEALKQLGNALIGVSRLSTDGDTPDAGDAE